MLTFEEKLSIIETFPELQRKDVSLGRVNFHYLESVQEKKIVVQHLHPNGNGFVYAGHMRKKETDRKGFINIRDYTEEELKDLIQKSIAYLSEPPVEIEEEEVNEFARLEGTWIGLEKQELSLVREDQLWNVYSGSNLEECFESPIEAERYLLDEGFRQSKKRKM
ncbi:hypothetical protein [Peribacillus butanolivorans]|uniref:Uncharacterized protein n=1 Tax=Peribacillus butanolivorans TaxID=421767 RepID=A0AAX0RS61_9BACI|nr:hypothetical protein [Peribacillus butanolivorans]AXN39986.1 hypothetical protein DTO10_17555 [Peribacillus butanolivorans]PEJ33915.1 hypothetical protein CN689_10765 [Peribacillus butanolivorans]QNU06127.1 hypothetical protein GM240_20925 [Peribacillus butanolivorans]